MFTAENWIADGARTLSRLHALDIMGFQPFFAGDDLEGNLVAFIQGFESLTRDGRVVHEDILAGILGDEAEPFFVVEPLDFAAGHISLLMLRGSAPNKKRTQL